MGSERTLRMAHLNLDNARAASAQLAQVIFSVDFQLVSINEPHTYENYYRLPSFIFHYQRVISTQSRHCLPEEC